MKYGYRAILVNPGLFEILKNSPPLFQFFKKSLYQNYRGIRLVGSRD